MDITTAYLNRLASDRSLSAKDAPVELRIAALAEHINAGNNSRTSTVGGDEVVYSASNAAAPRIQQHAACLGLVVERASGGIVTHPNFRAVAA